MSTPAKEKRFLDALEALFTGAKVEGDSGFVNLMRMKHAHFQSIKPKLMDEIEKHTKAQPAFREELFDKLHTFFSRYFCESGSIYFRHLPAFAKTYDRVYADGQDVALSWKTQMLYYVKSDVLVRSMPVTLNEEGQPQQTRRFHFDASECEHKKSNERRNFVFDFAGVKQGEEGKVIHLKVSYPGKKRTTKTDDIIKESRKGKISLTEEQLEKAFGLFQRQTEADFFINKDACKFLREQFDLWMYQYIFKEETVFGGKRIKQIQAIKDIAYNIIDFIAQFEDELRRVWEKPKFVRNVNYVVTLDKLTEGVLKKIAKHKSMNAQIEEWRKLELVEKGFSMSKIFAGQKSKSGKNDAGKKHQFLPLDTKFFKELELEILAELGNLDEALDGELVHSENWQALNSLHGKYKNRVKCIYIDPPFNLNNSDQYEYRTNYKDSCWATILENRLTLARDFLAEDGGIFVRCDYNGNWIARCLLDSIFGEKNHRNEIVVKRTRTLKGESKRFSTSQDSLFLYSKNLTDFIFFGYRTLKPEKEWKWVDMHLPGSRKDERLLYRDFFGKTIKAPKGRRWTLSQNALDNAISRGLVKLDEETGEPKFLTQYDTLGSNWMDISSYSKHWDFQTENSENLLQRCLKSISAPQNLVLDFFSGSGTTQAVAQKIGRKWLGVEMGKHFDAVVIPRMKKVLSGFLSGISEETSYKGGGVFKYYSLEQYEETLKNSHYQGGEQLELDSAKTPFQQYAFFADDKLTHAIKPKNSTLKIDLYALYPDIDIPESLANILGKQIRKRTADMVIFEDGSTEKTNPVTMNEDEKQHFISLIKRYLWWGE